MTEKEETWSAGTGDASEQGMAAQTEDLSMGEAIRVLTNQRRRAVLRHLMNHPEETVPADALVELVIAAETDTPMDPTRTRERITLDVQHIQLPYLRDAGVLEYEADSERVRYLAHPRLEALLQHLDRQYPAE